MKYYYVLLDKFNRGIYFKFSNVKYDWKVKLLI